MLPAPARQAVENIASLERQNAQLGESIRLLRRLQTSNDLALRTKDNRFYKSTIKDAQALLALDCGLDNKAAAVNCGLAASGVVLGTMAEQVSTEMAQTWEDAASGLSAGSSSDSRPVMTQALARLKQHALDIDDCKAFALAVVELAEAGVAENPPTAVVARLESAQRQVTLASDLQRFVALKAASAHKVRMLLHEMPPAARQAFNEVRALTEEIERQDAALDAVEDGPQADQAKAGHARVIESLLGQIEKAGDRFAEVAAQTWSDEGDGPQRWLHSLEYAQALGAFGEAFRELVERYPVTVVDEDPPVLADDAAAAESPARPMQSTAASSGAPGTQAPRKTTGPAPPAAAPELPAELSLALDRAQYLLRGSRKLTADMVAQAGADPFVLARMIGKDLGHVDAASGRDPMSMATSLHSSIQGWFGDVGRLRKVRDQIGSLQGEHPAEVRTHLARLDERIAALEAVHERILADEVSGLKTLERPKDKHVHRLLELGEVQAVTAPARLRSDGDVGALGTLFEMVIQPRRMPDGDVPRPIFLHVHTRVPVSEEQCLALDFDAFTAVHVKNAWQKNLGARWEQMQSSRENAGGRREQTSGGGGNADAPRVHRGRVGEQLWMKLRDQVG